MPDRITFCRHWDSAYWTVGMVVDVGGAAYRVVSIDHSADTIDIVKLRLWECVWEWVKGLFR